MVNPLFTIHVYHHAWEEGDPTMMGIMLLAAAANAPVLLASRDETQWRMFVRASLHSPRGTAARGRDPSRLRQLQGVVRSLDDDRRAEIPGPSGL